MAQKETINIELKTSIDKKAFDVLNASLDKAKIKLQQATQETGKNSLRTTEAKARVTALDGAIKKFTVTLDKSNAEIKEGSTELKSLGSSMSKVKSDVNSAEAPLSNMGTLIGVGVAGAVTYLISQLGNMTSAIIESASAGADYENLYRQFERLNGGAELSAQKLELLRTAAAGNLDDRALVQFANEMNSLGYSTDTTIKILDIAERKGDELGTSFETANSALQKYITTGAGRGLIELGINVAEVGEEIKKSTGLTEEQVNGLSELQQQTVRTNAILSLYGNSMSDIGKKTKGTDDQLASFGTTMSNVSNLMGVVLANAFGEAVKGMDDLDKSVDVTIEDAVKLGKQIGDLYNGMIKLGSGLQTVADYATLGLVPALREVYGILAGLTTGVTDFLGVTNSGLANVNNIVNQLSNDVIDPNKPFGPDRTEFDSRKAFQDSIKKVSSNSGNSGTSGTQKQTAETKQLKTEVDTLNEKLKETEALLLLATPGTNLFQKIADEIAELTKQITFLNAEVSKVDFTNKFPNLETLGERVRGFDLTNKRGNLESLSGEVQNVEGETPLKKTIADVETIGSSISSVMNTLGLGTNNFVNTLIAGFDSVLTIMQAIKAVNTVFSFIPGLATGGTAIAGMPHIVGERGAELFIPKTTGTVVNNSDTTKLLNKLAGSNSSQPVNVYINANMDGLTFLKKNFPNYQNYKKGKRIN